MLAKSPMRVGITIIVDFYSKNRKTCLCKLVNFIIVFIYFFGSRRPILIAYLDCLLNLIGFNFLWVLLKMCENC